MNLDDNFNEPTITPLKTGLKWGAYLGVAGIAISLLSHFMGWQNFEDLQATTNWYESAISLIVGIVITYLGIKYYKDRNEGLLTFGEGMSVALFIGIFAGILVALYMLIFAGYIVPDMGEAVVGAMDVDEMSEEEAEILEKTMGFFTSPAFMAISTFIGSIISSLFYGLICSLILKKD